MPLSNAAVKNTEPCAKQYKLTDGRGLFLLVVPTGGKCWRYKYPFEGMFSTRCNRPVQLTQHAQLRMLEQHISQAPILDLIETGEVSQDWHTNISFAEDGSVVEIVLLEARAHGAYPVQPLERVA